MARQPLRRAAASAPVLVSHYPTVFSQDVSCGLVAMVHRVSAENTVVRDWFQEPATAIARCSIMAKLERSKFPARPVGTTLATVGPFLLLFGLLYAAFGAASPFLPALMEARGIQAEQIGIIFGVATAIRLISAPVAGRIADRTHALRATLAACASRRRWQRSATYRLPASGRCSWSVCCMRWPWLPQPIWPTRWRSLPPSEKASSTVGRVARALPPSS